MSDYRTSWTVSLQEAAQILNLKRVGNEFKGPCVCCGGHDRFWLKQGSRYPILAQCRHGCATSIIFKELEARGLVIPHRASRRTNAFTGSIFQPVVKRTNLDQSPDPKTQEWASLILQHSKPATSSNPYLKKKELKPTDNMIETTPQEVSRIVGPKFVGIRKLKGRLLGIPICSGYGASLISWEFIDGEGRKMSMPGTNTRRGTFYSTRPLLQTDKVITICEGAATALVAKLAYERPAVVAKCAHAKPVSVATFTFDKPVVAALSNHNFANVAEHLKTCLTNPSFIFAVEFLANGERDPIGMKAVKTYGGEII